MTLTQALYDQICQERHFELLILCNIDFGQGVMTFDYNAVNDCIHVITGNEESFNSVARNYGELHEELEGLIGYTADFANDDAIKGIQDFLDTLDVLSLGLQGNSSLKNVVGTASVEELLDVLRTSDSITIRKAARKIDAQLILADYQPVLTM